MSNIVRRAEKKDIKTIMELLRQVNRVHHEGRPDLFKLATKYNEVELESIIEDDSKPVFVCENSKGQVLGHGFCLLQRPDNANLCHNNLTLYIDDICVDENVRGEHVGSDIYNHILLYARKKGCYNITLNVWTCNPDAMKFYEKLGLKPYKIGMEMLLD